jgi:hypothetical protein
MTRYALAGLAVVTGVILLFFASFGTQRSSTLAPMVTAEIATDPRASTGSTPDRAPATPPSHDTAVQDAPASAAAKGGDVSVLQAQVKDSAQTVASLQQQLDQTRQDLVELQQKKKEPASPNRTPEADAAHRPISGDGSSAALSPSQTSPTPAATTSGGQPPANDPSRAVTPAQAADTAQSSQMASAAPATPPQPATSDITVLFTPPVPPPAPPVVPDATPTAAPSTPADAVANPPTPPALPPNNPPPTTAVGNGPAAPPPAPVAAAPVSVPPPPPDQERPKPVEAAKPLAASQTAHDTRAAEVKAAEARTEPRPNEAHASQAADDHGATVSSSESDQVTATPKRPRRRPAPPPAPAQAAPLSPPPQIAQLPEPPHVPAMPDPSSRASTAPMVAGLTPPLSAPQVSPPAPQPPPPQPPPQRYASASAPVRRISAVDRLAEARTAVVEWRVEDARRDLQAAQLQLVFHPTDAGPESPRSSQAAGPVGQALAALGYGDRGRAIVAIDQALGTLDPSRIPRGVGGSPVSDTVDSVQRRSPTPTPRP